ncbi:MAG: hypothetical protein ACHQCF_05770 [Solirubrobacterales bacterium]
MALVTVAYSVARVAVLAPAGIHGAEVLQLTIDSRAVGADITAHHTWPGGLDGS